MYKRQVFDSTKFFWYPNYIYTEFDNCQIATTASYLKFKGFKDIQLLRRSVGDEVEFITIMRFDSIDAIRMFAGDDYEACVVPPSARKVLKRFDERSQHYEIKITEDGTHV